MKRKPKTRHQIISEIKAARIDRNVIIGQRVTMAIVLSTLYHAYDWDPEDLDILVDNISIALKAYNSGVEDIVDWIEEVKQAIGIDLLGETL